MNPGATRSDDEARKRLRAIEAILFAAGEPVPAREIAAVLGDAGEQETLHLLEALQAEYDRRGAGLTIEQVAGGFQMATRPEVGAVVRLFFRLRNRARLSPAALETLAIVAYRQPVTSPEIQAIRRVDPSASLKSLLEKKLVRILGRKKVVGNPLLYGTTPKFLAHFGLNRLEDLPSIEEFEPLLATLPAAVEPGAGANDGFEVPVAGAPDARGIGDERLDAEE